MKIVDERTFDNYAFGGLKLGDIFECEGFFYIKSKITLQNHQTLLGAVRIDNGKWAYFNDGDMITKADGTLVIK